MPNISPKKTFVEPQLTPQGSWQDLTGTFGHYNTSGGHQHSGKKYGGWGKWGGWGGWGGWRR
ncbi:MAG: putative RiPP precursor [Nitrospirales bacterium]